MVWAGFSWRGRTNLAILRGRVDSEVYMNTVENYLLPYGNSAYPKGYTFMQDGAPPHTSNATKQFLADCNLDVMEWPPYSPDLNPIENLWGILVQRVYKDFRQFETEDDLMERLLAEWEKLKKEDWRPLILSMQDRCLHVIAKRGGKTKY